NNPYFSKSIKEFWTRWHISLSSWFKDYVYIPFGGNRTSKGRMYVNLVFVFAISGLWHGANITFIIWGIIHGLFLIFESFLPDSRSTIYTYFRQILTLFLVTIAWVFFRANSVNDAFYILSSIFTNAPYLKFKDIVINQYGWAFTMDSLRMLI